MGSTWRSSQCVIGDRKWGFKKHHRKLTFFECSKTRIERLVGVYVYAWVVIKRGFLNLSQF